MNKIFAFNLNYDDEIKYSDEKDLINNYIVDESRIIIGSAERIYFPKNEKQVVRILKECNKLKKRATISGGGTGITGSRVPLGGIIIAMDDFTEIEKEPKENEKLIKKEFLGKTYSIIIGFDKEKNEYYAIAPPGIPLHLLKRMVEEEGLFYPPDPTELNAFLGGTVATNASGSRTFYFGTTRDYIRKLRVVLPTGEVIELERNKHKVMNWQFYIVYPDGKEIKVELPHYNFPNLKKNVAGYYIKKEMDLIDLFIGSEGTLGVFTEIEIKLLEKPKIIYPFYSMFKSENDALNFVKRLRSIFHEIEDKIISIEFFDENSVSIAKSNYPEIISKEPKSIIFFEIMSKSENHITKSLEKINEILEECNSITSLMLNIEKAREIRHYIPKSVNEFVRKHGLHKVATDIAVPEESFDEMFNYYHKIGNESKIFYVIFGHIGDFHLHFNFLPKNKEELEKALEYCTLLIKKAMELKGTPTAEHGVGKKSYFDKGKKKPLIDLIYNEEIIKEVIKMKRTIDPNLILNIGNIIPDEYLT